MTRTLIAVAVAAMAAGSAVAQDQYRIQHQRICRMRITTIQPAAAAGQLPMPKAADGTKDATPALTDLPIPASPATTLDVKEWHTQSSFTDQVGRRWELVTAKWLPSRKPVAVSGWILKMNDDKHYLITQARELFVEVRS